MGLGGTSRLPRAQHGSRCSARVISFNGFRQRRPKGGNSVGLNHNASKKQPPISGLATACIPHWTQPGTEVAKRSQGKPANNHVCGATRRPMPNKPCSKMNRWTSRRAIGFSHPVYLTALALAPGGKSVVSFGRNSSVMVWALCTGFLERTLFGWAATLRHCFTPPMVAA